MKEQARLNLQIIPTQKSSGSKPVELNAFKNTIRGGHTGHSGAVGANRQAVQAHFRRIHRTAGMQHNLVDGEWQFIDDPEGRNAPALTIWNQFDKCR